ncbi:MAG: hypothetical protein WBB28_01175 [Crinalium sp.]
MHLTFTTMVTGRFLGGQEIREEISNQTFKLLGASQDMEPEWRSNGAGGREHYTYGGEQCYVPYLYAKCLETEELVTYSLNGKFKENIPHPSPLPQEWGKTGSRFKIKKDGRVFWHLSRLLVKKPS